MLLATVIFCSLNETSTAIETIYATIDIFSKKSKFSLLTFGLFRMTLSRFSWNDHLCARYNFEKIQGSRSNENLISDKQIC